MKRFMIVSLLVFSGCGEKKDHTEEIAALKTQIEVLETKLADLEVASSKVAEQEAIKSLQAKQKDQESSIAKNAREIVNLKKKPSTATLARRRMIAGEFTILNDQGKPRCRLNGEGLFIYDDGNRLQASLAFAKKSQGGRHAFLQLGSQDKARFVARSEAGYAEWVLTGPGPTVKSFVRPDAPSGYQGYLGLYGKPDRPTWSTVITPDKLISTGRPNP